MSEIGVSKLQRLTTEIQLLNSHGIQVSIDIGKRLDEAKLEFENQESWLVWAENEFGYKHSHVYRLVTIGREFPRVGIDESKYSFRKLYALVGTDEEFLNQPHELPSGEVKTVDDMTAREIEQVKKAQRDAEQQLAKVQQELADINEQSASILERDRRLREENERLKREKDPDPVEIEKIVEPSDYEELKQTVKRQDEKLAAMSREDLARTHRYQVRNAVQDLDGSVASGLSEIRQKLAQSEEDWISDPHTANSIRTCIETLESATQALQAIISSNSGRSQTKRGVVIDGQFSDLA